MPLFHEKKLMDLGKILFWLLKVFIQLILLINVMNVLLGLYYLKNKNFRNVMIENYENLKIQIFDFLDNEKLSKIMKKFLNLFHM